MNIRVGLRGENDWTERDMSGQQSEFVESGSPVTFSFQLEAKPQRSWGIRHAFWFFAMGVGSALYLNELW